LREEYIASGGGAGVALAGMLVKEAAGEPAGDLVGDLVGDQSREFILV